MAVDLPNEIQKEEPMNTLQKMTDEVRRQNSFNPADGRARYLFAGEFARESYSNGGIG